VAAYLLAVAVASDPGSTLSTVVSLLPPFAPILMSVRIATGDATAWQVALAIVLTVASIAGLTWLAGRVYANSVRRLGKRVRFQDALRGE
jgi:ABC-2 type transport system permease protein